MYRKFLSVVLIAAASAASADEVPRASVIAPLADDTRLVDLARRGTEGVVAVGHRGHILLSDDGRQWTQVVAPHNTMLTRARFADANRGWVLGYDATILHTTDGGQSWTVQHWDPEGRPLYDLIIGADDKLIAVGGYGTYLTSGDGGATWTPEDNTLNYLGYHLNAGVRLPDGTLVIVGERSVMARSTDNGASWQLMNSPYKGSLFGVLPHGDAGILAFGMRGHVYVADDVTETETLHEDDFAPFMKETTHDPVKLAAMGWRLLATGTTESLFGGDLHSGQAFLVGVNGTAVIADPVKGQARLVPTMADESLGDALYTGSRWVAVGRRGVMPLESFE